MKSYNYLIIQGALFVLFLIAMVQLLGALSYSPTTLGLSYNVEATMRFYGSVLIIALFGMLALYFLSLLERDEYL